MKKFLLIITTVLALAGCGTTPPAKVEPSVVVQYKYVAAPIPEDALAIPEKVQPIDLNAASQKDVADWLARSEGRTNILESNLRTVKKIQDEQKKKSGDK